MPKKLDKLDHKYNEKLAKIRKSNVERHAVPPRRDTLSLTHINEYRNSKIYWQNKCVRTQERG